jgi:hypothetical protein
MNRPDESREMPAQRPALGDRVRVKSGQLEGLTGIVQQITQGGQLVLVVDHWAEGVSLVVTEGVIEAWR